MVNVTILNKKDILKYGIKLGIVLVSLFLITELAKNVNSQEAINFQNILNKDKLKICLEQTMPMLKQVNGEEEYLEEKIRKINILEYVVSKQLAMIKEIKPKEVKKGDDEKVKVDEQKEQSESIEQAKTGLETKVLESNVPTKFTNEYNGVKVRNETEYELTEEMLKPEITVNNKSILIFHTHTCESYTPSEKFEYIQTGTYRTTDFNYNVVRVGTELTNQLKSYGYNVIHDNTYHDYPAYNGSYGRSLITVKNLLGQYNNTDIVIDLHRDAIGDYNYAPTVQIGEEQAAQIMFVIGTDGGRTRT